MEQLPVYTSLSYASNADCQEGTDPLHNFSFIICNFIHNNYSFNTDINWGLAVNSLISVQRIKSLNKKITS